MAMPAIWVATSVRRASSGLGPRFSGRYMANEPSTSPCGDIIGVDQHALNPQICARSRYSAQSGSVITSVTTTGFRVYMAVPQEPARGPIGAPSTAFTYGSGRLG